MTDHKPGRETDADVHRALWPEARIEKRWCGQDYECGEWSEVQHLYELGDPFWKPKDGLGDDKQLWCWAEPRIDGTGEDYIEWHIVPAYTTALTAWDGVGDELGWFEASEAEYQVQVYWRLKPYSGQYPIYADAAYADHDNGRFRAQAMARAECVLRWAERQAS